MQSRRPEDCGARSRDLRAQEGPSDHYLMPRHEVSQRSPPPRRVVGGGERTNGSFEGRDFHRWDVRGETDHLRSQSTRFGRLDERRHSYNENYSSRDELRTNYDFRDTVDHGNELDTGLKHGGYGGSRDNFGGDAILGVAEHQMLSDRQMVLEPRSMHRGEYRLRAELDSSIRDAEDAAQFLLPSRNPDHGRFNNECNQYPDPFLLEKLAAIERERYSNVEKSAAMGRIERYGEVEELIAKSKDVSYLKGSASATKEFSDIPQSKEFGATPLRSSRVNILGSYEDDVPLPTEVHPRSSAEHYLTNRLHERQRLGGRDFAANREDLLGYRRAEFSPLVYESYPRDYTYSRHGSRENGNQSQVSEELSKKLHYPKQGGYYRGDNISSDGVDPTKQRVAYADYSQKLHSSRDLWDEPTSRIRSASDYLHDDRAEQVGMFLDRRSAINEFDNKVLIEPEVRQLDMLGRDGLSHRRITHVSERDALLVSGRESVRAPFDNQCEIEMQEHDFRRKGISSNDLFPYDLSQGSSRRKKYHIDEELSCYQHKKTLSSRVNYLNGEDQQDGEWNSEEASDLLPSKRLKYSSNINTRIGRTVDHVDHGGDSTSYELWLSDDQPEYLQEYSSKPFNPGKRMSKGLPRYGPSKSYKLSSSNQRHYLSTNAWSRAKENKLLEESANEKWESKVMVSSSESGRPEDSEGSEEFKQLVQEYFLSFSKILNEKIGTRKRYKEQGRAGSLYCIVCGKRSSKEFFDTRSLATHCFMSQKVELRARHLGLHKAICVLLGWNSVVGLDVITFTPQVLSSSEALAQKEDLILWPPTIIIQSISMSASHIGGQIAFTKEGVEDFLRGEGFSLGKIKVCPGISANNDIMVVKFLGTFSGLQDATNLHNYFVNEKHGRTDYEQQMSLSNGSRKERILEPKLEEPLLYGFMGISEDLDKVDFDTKRRCCIKSKREIEYIAEAPLTQ